MARASRSTLKEIYDSRLSDNALDVWLNMASDRVDDIADANSNIDSERLTDIELMLAAHYASAQDQRHERDSGESRSTSYQGETGMGIKGTKYGQRAAALDPTGILASEGKPSASFSVPDAKGTTD